MTAHRRRRALGLLAAVLLLGNLLLWAAGSQMTPPLEFHTWIAQHKVEQMDAAAAPCTDLAVIGSSVGLMGIDPARLTETVPSIDSAYNASLGGSFASFDVEWYQEQVEPRLHPSVLLHVVGFTSVSLDREGARDIAASWDAARATDEGPMADVDRSLSAVVPAMRYRERLRDPAEWWALLGGELPADRAPDVQVDLVTPTGFMARSEVGDPAKVQEYSANIRRLMLDEGEPVQQAELQALGDHVLRARRRGTQVVLVMAPTHPTYRPAIAREPADFERYRDAMRALARDVQAPLIDVTDLELPLEQVWDGVHYNVAGAAAFTDAVAAELNAGGVASRCP